MCSLFLLYRKKNCLIKPFNTLTLTSCVNLVSMYFYHKIFDLQKSPLATLLNKSLKVCTSLSEFYSDTNWRNSYLHSMKVNFIEEAYFVLWNLWFHKKSETLAVFAPSAKTVDEFYLTATLLWFNNNLVT